jgi:hypothetical protein
MLETILKTPADALRRYEIGVKEHFLLKTYDYLSDLPPVVKSIVVKKDKLGPYISKLVVNLDGG